MHLCFIVENSLTMLPKTSNSQLNIFDQIKHSLETVLKNVFRTWSTFLGKQNNDVIHLFVTSSTEPISSYLDNHEMHILQQIRDLQCTIPTFPAEVIESALYHVGKFKCLNETETCLGYRQGNVSEPAFVFYITDNSNARQIQKINQKILEGKFHLRAEYKFVTIKYCAPSQNEASLNNRDKFKSFVESQKESLMMEQVMRKVNGKLLYTYSSDQLVNSIQNILFKGIETITMGLSNKEYKIYNKEIFKLQFPTAAAQQKYFQRLKSLKKQNTLTKTIEQSSVDLFVDCIQTYTRPSIPLPYQITPKILTQGKIIIDQFEPLKYFVDFTKEYIGSLGQGMRFLRNIFQLSENKELLGVFQDFPQEKKFPLFYEREKIQYLIGYLRVFLKQPQNPLSRACQLHISFSNFTNLNATIRSYFQRNQSAEQYFQNYISTLPMFYHKTLKSLLSFSNIALSPLTQRCFENIHNKPIGLINMKLYEQRLAEKNQLALLQKESFDSHQSRTSKCCSIYSESFEQFQIQRSKFYSSQHPSTSSESKLSKFFQESIKKLNQLQPNTFLLNHLTEPQITSKSMTFQVKKYSNIRRNDQEMDRLVGGIFGNPFRKISKKVKLHVQAESVWVEPQEVGMMKELLNKQMEVYSQLLPQLQAQQIAQMEKIMKMDSIYDKLAGVKGIIGDAINRAQNLQKIQNEKLKNSQVDKRKNQQKPYNEPYRDNNFNVNQNENRQYMSEDQSKADKMIEQEREQLEISTEQLNEEQQKLMYNCMEEKAYKQVSVKKQTQKQSRQGENMLQESSQASNNPQIIEQVNCKFPMLKSAVLQIPTYLIHKDLYTRNKFIINDTLLAYLGLATGSK